MGISDKAHGKFDGMHGKVTGDKKVELKGKAEQKMVDMRDKMRDAKDKISHKM